MTLQNMQFQKETRASIQSLKNQMGQMATQLNQAQSQNSDKFPSQTQGLPGVLSADFPSVSESLRVLFPTWTILGVYTPFCIP
uniref:Uncharacterized protein n=1 Tax=Cajanus cajan TaxID=3821 RepID=A0A151QL17_CAJCA|nr:hypothetical protein KK1_049341 [Cajanus cajan]